MSLMKISKLILKSAVLLFCVLIPALALCGTAENLFLEANSQYEKGNYADAVRLYRMITDYGIKSPVVYYNLGNGYYKLGEIGEAILSYEKALKLDPGDRETRQNLELANLVKYDRVEQKEPSPPLRFALWMHNLFSLDAQLVIGLILLYLSSYALASLVLRRRRGRSADLAIFALTVLMFFLVLVASSAGMKIYRIENSSYGIVLTEKIDVLSGPGETNAVLFPVHEGIKIRVRAVRDEWYQISLPNGLNGWVKKENIGII